MSGWDLVMRVYFVVFIFLLFHTSNYCIAFLFLASDKYRLSNEVVVHYLGSVWMVV